METKPVSIANRSYEDFDPVCKWRREESRDTLEVHLPGFRREHIRVQVNHLGFMVVSGERQFDGPKWRRFRKEIEIPTYCNEEAVHAKFMPSILTVVMPRKISPISQKDQEIRQIPEFEPEKDKDTDKETYQNMEFIGRGARAETERTGNEALREDINEAKDEFEGNSSELTPEITRKVALKLMLVVIVIWVIGSYVTDMFKSIVADSFHN